MRKIKYLDDALLKHNLTKKEIRFIKLIDSLTSVSAGYNITISQKGLKKRFLTGNKLDL